MDQTPTSPICLAQRSRPCPGLTTTRTDSPLRYGAGRRPSLGARARSLGPHLVVFALLNGADLFLTWRLLTGDLLSVREGNPLAAWVLDTSGWAGLAALKALTTSAVAAAALAISARRPRLACRLLSCGCGVLALVVGYSARIPDVYRALGNPVLDEEAARVAVKHRLDAALREAARPRELKERLAEGLIAGRYRFAEAAERLAAADFASDPALLAHCRREYQLEDARDCYAANLLVFALVAVRNDPARWGRLAPQWVADYRAHFRVSTRAPWQARVLVGAPPLPELSPGPPKGPSE